MGTGQKSPVFTFDKTKAAVLGTCAEVGKMVSLVLATEVTKSIRRGENMRKKEKIIVFIVSIIIASITYVGFFEGYFTTDSAKFIEYGYMGYATQWSLYDGRIVMFLIECIANFLHIGLQNLNIFLFSISLIILSGAVVQIYDIINKIKPLKNKIMKVAMFIVSFLLIFNFTMVDSLQWSECIIITLSVLIQILAAKKLVLEEKKIVSLIYVIFGLICYQGTINVFIAMSFLFILITNDKEQIKKIIKDIAYMCLVTAIAVGIDCIMVSVIHSFIETVQSSRTSLDIVANMKIMMDNMSLVTVHGLYIYPDFLQNILVLGLIIITYINDAKNRKFNYIYVVSIAIISVLACLSVGILHPGTMYQGNGRCFTALGMIVSEIIIYMYCCTDCFENKIWNKALIVFILFYFIINGVNQFHTCKEMRKVNEIDRNFSYEIRDNIKKYEEETSNEINYISLEYYIRSNENIKRKTIPMVSYKQNCIYNGYTYELYTGEKLKKQYFDEEVLEQHFKNDEDKMMCIGDTIYVKVGI